jgi:hypothetical protein
MITRSCVAVIVALLLSIVSAHAFFPISGSYTPTPSAPVFTAWTGQVNSNGTNLTGCPTAPPPGETFSSCLTATKTSGSIVAGDCVFVFVHDTGTHLLTVVDDNSPADQFSSGPAGVTGLNNNQYLETFYLLNAQGGGSHVRVAEISSQATIKSIQVEEASNCGKYLDPATATGVGNSVNSASTAPTSGSMTTSVNGDLIVGVAMTSASTTSITYGAGFTPLSAAPTTSGTTTSTGPYSSGTNHYFIETEYQVQNTGPGPIAATFTSGSDTWAAAALAIAPVGYVPPALTLVQTPLTMGDNVTFGSGGNGQQCVWHIPAIGTGDAVVGYVHSTDINDAVQMPIDYINIGSTAAGITPSVNWVGYAEDITYFYLSNITGNPNTVTVDFPSSDGGTLGFDSCNIGLTEYTGVGGFTVTNPADLTGTTTIQTQVTPSTTSRIWTQAAILSGYPTGITSGYNQTHDDWLWHGIGAWQSSAANLTGTQTITAQLGGVATSGVLGAIAVQTVPSESPFTGTPFNVGVAIPAAEWDLGGAGLAFQATNSCGIGYYTTLGADRLNVYQNSDPSSSDGLSIGCNQLNDYHNYTINVTTPGTYQVTLRVGNIATGATYNILKCTTAGQSCTTLATGLSVPNTGDYTPSSNITSSSFSLSTGAQVIQIQVSAASSSTGFAGDIDQVTISAPGVATITGVTVAGTTTPSYTSGATSVGAVGVSETGGTFGGTLAICEGLSCTPSGTSTTHFSLSSSSLPSNLNIASSAQTCSSSISYPISIAPTQAGVVNSGTAYALTVTCNPVVSASGTLTLTNGAPNIGVGTSGSCTITTCTWIQAGSSGVGQTISDVYFDESPMSVGYQGTFSLGTASGCSSAPSNFAISQDNYNDPYGVNHHYAHITTTGSLTAGSDITIYVCAGSPVVSQQVIVHPVSGTAVACSGNITSALQSAVNGGGTALVSGGNCTSGPLTISSNMQIIGYGRDQTIINGNNSGTWIDAANPHIVGGTIRNFTATDFGNVGGCTFGQPQAIQLYNGWAAINTAVTNSGGSAYTFFNDGNSTVSFINNRMISSGYDGVGGSFGLTQVATNGTVNIIGNEVSGSNVACNQSIQNDVAAIGKFGGSNNGSDQTDVILVENNYDYDNNSMAMWEDFNKVTSTFTQNTVINAITGGNLDGPPNAIQVEISNGTQGCSSCYSTMSYNFLNNSALFGLYTRSSDNVSIHDNNVLASGGNNTISILFQSDGTDSCHEPVYNNTVTFAGSSESYSYFGDGIGLGGSSCGNAHFDGVGTCASGSENQNSPTCSNDNLFFVEDGNTTTEAHWSWDVVGDNMNLQTWASYRSSTGQDAQSTLASDPSGSHVASGCTHVACSSAGVGPHGVKQ